MQNGKKKKKMEGKIEEVREAEKKKSYEVRNDAEGQEERRWVGRMKRLGRMQKGKRGGISEGSED